MECSCLARCDRGAAVGRPTGEIEERINGAPACAALLRKMGYTIDQRLSDAYTATERADELVAEGRGEEALNAYKRDELEEVSWSFPMTLRVHTLCASDSIPHLETLTNPSRTPLFLLLLPLVLGGTLF